MGGSLIAADDDAFETIVEVVFSAAELSGIM
jgi:hypothetical protein